MWLHLRMTSERSDLKCLLNVSWVHFHIYLELVLLLSGSLRTDGTSMSKWVWVTLLHRLIVLIQFKTYNLAGYQQFLMPNQLLLFLLYYQPPTPLPTHAHFLSQQTCSVSKKCCWRGLSISIQGLWYQI